MRKKELWVTLIIVVCFSIVIVWCYAANKEKSADPSPYILNDPQICTYRISEDKPLSVIITSVDYERERIGKGIRNTLTVNFNRYDNNESGKLILQDDSYVESEDYRILKNVLQKGDIIEIYAKRGGVRLFESFQIKFNWLEVNGLKKELAY